MIAEHTVETPCWIKALVEDLTDCVTPLGFIGPLGYRYWEPDDPANPADAWQLVVYPTPNEVRGPDANDGAMFVSGFRLDVGRIIGTFCEISEVVWSSPAKHGNNLDGPEISLKGRYTTKTVWLRFFSLPPPDEPPAYAVDPAAGTAVELPA